MAVHQMITVDGKRVDITSLPVEIEHSCDGCGKFSKDADLTKLFISVNHPGAGRLDLEILMHSKCLPKAGEVLVKSIDLNPPF